MPASSQGSEKVGQRVVLGGKHEVERVSRAGAEAGRGLLLEFLCELGVGVRQAEGAAAGTWAAIADQPGCVWQ